MKKIAMVENLINKALDNGNAKVNGRINYGYGQKGQLEEKYSATVKSNRLTFKHWGTVTLEAFKDANGWNISDFYGQSQSDRDSLNTALDVLDISGVFRYKTSTGKFYFDDSE